MLIGLLGIPAVLWACVLIQIFCLIPPKLNTDYMAFFEEGIAIRWDMYNTGGTGKAYRGLDLWLKETEGFAQKVKRYCVARACQCDIRNELPTAR